MSEQLWYACLDGDIPKVKQLIHEGADLFWKGPVSKHTHDYNNYFHYDGSILFIFRFTILLFSINLLKMFSLYDRVVNHLLP